MSHVVVDNPHGLDQQVSTLNLLLISFFVIEMCCFFHYAHVVSTEKEGAS